MILFMIYDIMRTRKTVATLMATAMMIRIKLGFEVD